MTPTEKAIMGVIVLMTCGVGLLVVIPYAIYKNMQARGFHCPKCGEQIV